LAYSGGAAVVRWLRHRRGDHRIYILAYHDVAAHDRHEAEGTLSGPRFRRQMLWVKQRYALISMTDAAAMLAENTRLERDYAVVTFDDGYAGNYEHAFPIIANERIPATIFLTTGFLDGEPLWFDGARRLLALATKKDGALTEELRARLRTVFGGWPPAEEEDLGEHLKKLSPAVRDQLLAAVAGACGPVEPHLRPLTWEQVRHMAAAGIEIGCHTVSHPILSTLGAEQQRAEVTRARDRIAAEIDRPVRLFAYPNGGSRDFTADTVAILKDAGFDAACSMIRGANAPGCDRYELKRIGIGADPRHVLEARFCGMFDEGVRRRFGNETSASRTGVAVPA
jgi:peptidoglycan/xylan/chitin deacetylase (PgdA/CDA1 family)